MHAPDRWQEGRRSRQAALVVAFLFVLVGAALRFAQARDPYERVSADERAYGSIAVELAERGRYWMADGNEPWHWAPGTPVFFAVAQRIAPTEPGREPHDISAVYWAQALVGTATIVLAWGLSLRLAGRWAAALTAAAVALYPPLITFTGEQVSEPLGAMVLTGAVLVFVGALRRRTLGSCLASGMVLGVAVLVRTDLLAVAGLLVVWLFATQVHRSLLNAAVSTAVCCVGFTAVVAPWIAFVSLRTGAFTPITTAGPPALFIGTFLPGGGTTSGMKHALASEVRARFPEMVNRLPDDIPGGYVTATVAMRHPELDREAALLAESRRNLTRYAIGRPGAFLAMMLQKSWHMWSRPATGGAIEQSGRIGMAHGIVVGAAVIGGCLGWWRTRNRVFVMVFVMLAIHTTLHAVTVAQPRYALPFMPVLLATGAAGGVLFVRRHPSERVTGHWRGGARRGGIAFTSPGDAHRE